MLDHVDVNGMGISPVDIHDEMQNTPLHVAVKFSEEKNVQLLLQHGADPNAVGKNESTPLHKARSPRMAEILLSYGADPYKMKYSKNELLKTAYDVFLNKNASAANMLLDNGITSNGRDLTSTNLVIIFDFKPFRRQTSFSNGEMALHHKIVLQDQKNLLKHPLVESFLQLKYRLIRPLFLINILFFLIFTLSITTLATLDTAYCRNLNSTLSCFLQGEVDDKVALNCFVFLYALTGLAMVILFFREVIQMLQTRLRYLKDYENLIEMLMIGCSLAYLITLYTNYVMAPHFGASAVLLAWMDLTLLTGRFPAIGIYVYMSVHVTIMLVAFLLFYATFLLGFTFAFHLLLPSSLSFSNPINSIMKVLVMMAGEFEFETHFLPVDGPNGKSSNRTTQIVFILFLFVVSIVISNLLIAMTVSKTEELFKKAGVIRLEKTVGQVKGIEDIVEDKRSFLGILPASLKNKLLEMTELFTYLEKLNGSGMTYHEYLIKISGCYLTLGFY